MDMPTDGHLLGFYTVNFWLKYTARVQKYATIASDLLGSFLDTNRMNGK